MPLPRRLLPHRPASPALRKPQRRSKVVAIKVSHAMRCMVFTVALVLGWLLLRLHVAVENHHMQRQGLQQGQDSGNNNNNNNKKVDYSVHTGASIRIAHPPKKSMMKSSRSDQSSSIRREQQQQEPLQDHQGPYDGLGSSPLSVQKKLEQEHLIRETQQQFQAKQAERENKSHQTLQQRHTQRKWTSSENKRNVNHEPPLQRSARTSDCSCVDCAMDTLCGGLWRGGALGGDANAFTRIHLVVSFCNSELDWLTSFVGSHKIAAITVYSKCGQTPTVPTSLSSSTSTTTTSVVDLPNTGGCDHSYLYWIVNEYFPKQRQSSGSSSNAAADVVVFIKDTFRPDRNDLAQPGHPRLLNDMLRIASVRKFACAIELHNAKWEDTYPDLSTYHVTSKLEEFVLLRYQRTKSEQQHAVENFHRPSLRKLSKFVQHFGLKFPSNVTEVCYGGGFAVTPDRFESSLSSISLDTWKRLQDTLQRGDNIEEAHHMERSWAAILSTPLYDENDNRFKSPFHLQKLEALWKHSTGVAIRRGSIMGALKREVN